jgi:hypothetical protein
VRFSVRGSNGRRLTRRARPSSRRGRSVA